MNNHNYSFNKNNEVPLFEKQHRQDIDTPKAKSAEVTHQLAFTKNKPHYLNEEPSVKKPLKTLFLIASACVALNAGMSAREAEFGPGPIQGGYSVASGWSKASDFPATKVHAVGNMAVAWNANNSVAISRNQGQSWDTFETSTWGNRDGSSIKKCITDGNQAFILMHDGSLLNENARSVNRQYGLGPVSNVVIDGRSRVWMSDGQQKYIGLEDGSVVKSGKGSVKFGVADGALIYDGSGLKFISPLSESKVDISDDQRIASSKYVHPSGIGSNYLITEEGVRYTFDKNRVVHSSEMETGWKVLSQTTSKSGRTWSVMEHDGESSYLRTKKNEAWSSEPAFNSLSSGIKSISSINDDRFIAVGRDGIFVRR